jgi:xanthine dehydrogenase accessory factor
MIFAEHLVVIRGGGDLATGVAYRLHKAGFPLIVLELQQPMVVRRAVALATAVSNGTVDVEDLRGVRVDDVPRAEELASTGVVPVLVQPQLEPVLAALSAPPAVVVDARMAKRNLDTARNQAPLVIALGPGFNAGVDCDAVVETMRGHKLGRVFWRGAAKADTGTPGIVAGKGRERVLRAPATGTVAWARRIGDVVSGNEQLGAVAEQPVLAPFDGVVRGLIAPGTSVREGQKIGDVDARADPAACYLISDKALAIGGGVLEAVLTWLNQTDA